MWRIKFLFSLILLGACLLAAAHTLPTILSLVTPNHKPAVNETQPPSQFMEMMQNTFRFLQRVPEQGRAFAEKIFSRPPEEKPEPLPVQPARPKRSSPANVLQITLEDEKPPLYNPALGQEASARLEEFLNLRKEKNALLASDARTYFGERAQQEVLFVLMEDEKDSLANALNSRSAQDFATRQTQTDQKTQEQLNKIFERYKTSFTKPLYIAPLTNSKFF